MNARLTRLICHVKARFPDIQLRRQGIIRIPNNRHSPRETCLIDSVGSESTQNNSGQSVRYRIQHVVIALQEYAFGASVQNADDIARPVRRIAVGSKHAGRRKRGMTGNRIFKAVAVPTTVRFCKLGFVERFLRLSQRFTANGALVTHLTYILMRTGLAAHTETRREVVRRMMRIELTARIAVQRFVVDVLLPAEAGLSVERIDLAADGAVVVRIVEYCAVNVQIGRASCRERV